MRDARDRFPGRGRMPARDGRQELPVHSRVIRIGREALRCLLTRRGITLQRTKTWKESRTQTGRRSWMGSKKSWTASRTGSSPSASSARWGSGPPRARAGPPGRRQHVGRAEVDPCRPARRRPDVRKVELCFTPTYASWANPIEAHFGPLRQFTIAHSNRPHHTVQIRALHAYLRWRNANARHRDILAAEREERARIRSEKGIRWGGRPLTTAA